MASGEEKVKRFHIGIRGILYFTTAVAISLGLMRYAVMHEVNPALKPAQLFAAIIGPLMIGSAIGGACGQLFAGTTVGVMQGILLGGLAMILSCASLIFLIFR